jgi:hypothetical protein
MFSIALLTIIGFVAASVPARADERCERRVHQAEEKLRQAIDRHGEHSKQAHKRREELENVRRSCGYHDHDHDHDHH